MLSAVATLRETLTVRDAVGSDAEAIWELKQAAFSPYLAFTPYRAEASVEHLREIVLSSASTVRVAFEGERLLGYSIHTNRHLSYIASAAPGRGVGGALLCDFEREVREAGGTASRLDVFDSNVAARAWYERTGYRTVASAWSFSIDLTAVEDRGPDLVPDRGSLVAGLARERERGVGRFWAKLDGQTVRLGLLAGDAIRVLDSGEAPLDLLASAVARWALPERRGLVVCGADAPPPRSLRLRQCERSLRMEKRL